MSWSNTWGAACPPFQFLREGGPVKACVFVDGENLRYSINDLFNPGFRTSDYLPNRARWADLFDHIVALSSGTYRVRAYWYVVEEIEFYPWGLQKRLHESLSGPPQMEKLQNILFRDRQLRSVLEQVEVGPKRDQRITEQTERLIRLERKMKTRFEGWHRIQKAIAESNNSVEFRRSGSIRFDLFRERFNREKAVDVHLGTDMLKLRDIYEVAIIVSGDGDYVPAVQAVKDYGKRSINVSFLKKDGQVIPGGARTLNRNTDEQVQISYDEMKDFMQL